jgi:hypothetical protein
MADPSEERLEELGDRIDKARRDAEEDGLLPDSTPEPSYRDPDPDDELTDDELIDDAVPPDSPARGVVEDGPDDGDAPEPSEPA